MRALVFIMNARAIPECVESYKALDVDLLWATGFTVAELVEAHATVVHDLDYDVILNVSDDCVVSQAALDAVLAQMESGAPAATGWCRLHVDTDEVNICHSPLVGNIPRRRAYPFYRYDEVMGWTEEAVPTHFMGMSLTGLTRDLWKQYPYGCFRFRRSRGHSSDFHLCRRLRDGGVPMVAARSGYVDHLKERHAHGEEPSGKFRLLTGEVERELVLDLAADRRATA